MKNRYEFSLLIVIVITLNRNIDLTYLKSRQHGFFNI